MGRHIIIGDVHGMKLELVALLENTNFSKEDHLVFVGDLLDKGPDSAGVVRFVRELSASHDVTVVEGNHENKHTRFRANSGVRPGVAKKMAEAQPELESITGVLTQEDKEFLGSVVPFHRIPEHNVLVVHAGIPANMDWFPSSVEEAVSLGGKKKKSFGQVMRVREVCKETGKFLALGAAGEDDPFWAEVWDGRFGHVVFGHTPCREVMKFPHATGIDTGAVFGGKLTAMVIDGDLSKAEFVSVEGKPFSKPIAWMN
jgi:serine/threonine protein phosphatase 1